MLIYTTSQKSLNSKICNVFKEVSSAQPTCIHLIHNTAKTVAFLNFLFEIYFKK